MIVDLLPFLDDDIALMKFSMKFCFLMPCRIWRVLVVLMLLHLTNFDILPFFYSYSNSILFECMKSTSSLNMF